MREHGYNYKDVYEWCDLLDTDEWHAFSRDPLNDTKRACFLDRMTYRLDDREILDTPPDFESALVNAYPPYASSYNSMSIDVRKVE